MAPRIDAARTTPTYRPNTSAQDLVRSASTATPSAAPTASASTRAMWNRMSDGFDFTPLAGANSSSAPSTAAPAKKKKKKKGFFKKLGGFLKKALPIVSKIASFIPGLNVIAKPLEIASGLLNR